MTVDDYLMTAAECRVLMEIANGRPGDLALDDLTSSRLLVAAAAYLAVEETWTPQQSTEVLEKIEALLPGSNELETAAMATRGAMLDVWWVRGEAPRTAWDRAIEWARLATEAKPDWLMPWLVLFDGHIFLHEFDRAESVARRMMEIVDPSPNKKECSWAVEELFTGRLGWTKSSAEDLMQKARRQADRGTRQ